MQFTIPVNLDIVSGMICGLTGLLVAVSTVVWAIDDHPQDVAEVLAGTAFFAVGLTLTYAGLRLLGWV